MYLLFTFSLWLWIVVALFSVHAHFIIFLILIIVSHRIRISQTSIIFQELVLCRRHRWPIFKCYVIKLIWWLSTSHAIIIIIETLFLKFIFAAFWDYHAAQSLIVCILKFRFFLFTHQLKLVFYLLCALFSGSVQFYFWFARLNTFLTSAFIKIKIGLLFLFVSFLCCLQSFLLTSFDFFQLHY
jgi:hypothetical protein